MSISRSFEPEQPFPVIGTGEINVGRQRLAIEARSIDVERAGRAHRTHHRQHAAFPFGVEHRLVRLRLDLAEAVHAAHVVHAVHDGAPGVFGNPGADHRVARHELGELLLAPAVGALGAHRQHQEARLGGRIPDPDFGFLGQADAEVGEHAARVLDGAGTVGRGLVPDRRQSQHFPGVTGAQRTHDHVVALRRILDRDEMIADPADVAERAHGLGGVFQQGAA